MTQIVADGPAVPYTPPEVLAPNANQVFTVFTPPDPVGAILIHNDAGNFLAQAPRTVFDDVADPTVAWIVALWSAGVTIVSVGLTGFDSGVLGGGLWRPYDSDEYLNRFDYAWPERDAEYIVQKIRRMALLGQIAGDTNRIGWAGTSSGAVSGMAVGLGPDRRRSSGSPEVRTTTLLGFLVCIEPPAWWPAYDQAVAAGLHFPLGGVGTTPAPRLEDVPVETQSAASPITWYTDRLAAGLSMPPIYLAYDCPAESTDFGVDAEGFPTLFDTLVTVHPYWHGVTFGTAFRTADANRYQTRARMGVLDSIALPPPNDLEHYTFQALYDLGMQTDLLQWAQGQTGSLGPQSTGPVISIHPGDV